MWFFCFTKLSIRGYIQLYCSDEKVIFKLYYYFPLNSFNLQYVAWFERSAILSALRFTPKTVVDLLGLQTTIYLHLLRLKCFPHRSFVIWPQQPNRPHYNSVHLHRNICVYLIYICRDINYSHLVLSIPSIRLEIVWHSIWPVSAWLSSHLDLFLPISCSDSLQFPKIRFVTFFPEAISSLSVHFRPP